MMTLERLVNNIGEFLAKMLQADPYFDPGLLFPKPRPRFEQVHHPAQPNTPSQENNDVLGQTQAQPQA